MHEPFLLLFSPSLWFWLCVVAQLTLERATEPFGFGIAETDLSLSLCHCSEIPCFEEPFFPDKFPIVTDKTCPV